MQIFLKPKINQINLVKLIIQNDRRKKGFKKCSGKKNIMFAYGFIQLGSSFVSAIALAAMAFGFCSVKKSLSFLISVLPKLLKMVVPILRLLGIAMGAIKNFSLNN